MRIEKLANRESGYALPFSLLSVAIFSVFILTFMGLLTNELRVNRQLVDSWQARYVAEAGVENALYNVKIAVQNNSSPYALDMKTNAFGTSGYSNLLPAIPFGKTYPTSTKTLVLGQPYDEGNFTWVIKYEKTLPVTPQNPPPGELTNYLYIESVGTYKEKTSVTLLNTVNFRVTAYVKVTFQPILIPDSPVKIEFISYTERPGKFDWEP